MTSPRFDRKIPEGDTLPRLVCSDCGFINYQNPKIIAGVVPVYEDKILLCVRAIEPRVGYWTVPAGFLEMGETPAEGAAREAVEEASCTVEVGDLIGVYTIRHIGQVQMFYRGRLATPEFAPGPESSEVQLFSWDEIPWDDLAFPTIKWALQDFESNLKNAQAIPHARIAG